MSTLYCPKCGYNLTGLKENRCPECGKVFDPRLLRAMQRVGISTRSVVWQIILAPAGFAFLFTFCICTGISSSREVAWLVSVVPFILLVVILHTTPLSRAFVRTHQLRHGRGNVAWLFRSVWPFCIIFALLESALTLIYLIGGSLLIYIFLALLLP